MVKPAGMVVPVHVPLIPVPVIEVNTVAETIWIAVYPEVCAAVLVTRVKP
jgi:hypothetical protein